MATAMINNPLPDGCVFCPKIVSIKTILITPPITEPSLCILVPSGMTVSAMLRGTPIFSAVSILIGIHVIKVLAIGNSFSVDAVEQNLYELAAAAGDSLVIGNAYIGGCSIDRHWSNAQTQKAEYSYRKVIGGVLKSEENRCLDDIVKDESWDIVTLQQASPLSGDYPSYVHLSDLMNYVRRTVTNPAFKFAFHMTWAYACNATHPGFATYGKNQVKMYQAILQAVHQATADNHIDRIIPSGIAIQRARAVLGDTLNRDGYHLSYTVGRYTAACTWCEFLTGKSVVGNTYRPSSVSATDAMIAQYAAHQAMLMI